MKKTFSLLWIVCVLMGCAAGKHPTFTWETDADWWTDDRKMAEDSVGCMRCGILQHRKEVEELSREQSTIQPPEIPAVPAQK